MSPGIPGQKAGIPGFRVQGPSRSCSNTPLLYSQLFPDSLLCALALLPILADFNWFVIGRYLISPGLSFAWLGAGFFLIQKMQQHRFPVFEQDRPHHRS
jgi:hypothetical protein